MKIFANNGFNQFKDRHEQGFAFFTKAKNSEIRARYYPETSEEVEDLTAKTTMKFGYSIQWFGPFVR